MDYSGGAELNGKGRITMDLFQQEIPCLEYWAYLNRGLNLRMLNSMGNGQPGLISTGNSMFTIFGLFQQGKFKVSWIQWEKKDNQDSFQWEISARKSQVYYIWLILVGRNAGEAGLNGKGGSIGHSFQWEILCLQYLAYLNGRDKGKLDLTGEEWQPGFI